MSSSKEQQQQQQQQQLVLQNGDRVILHNFEQTKILNGRHGRIVRVVTPQEINSKHNVTFYAVILDTPMKTVMVKIENLIKETIIVSKNNNNIIDRVPVSESTLESSNSMYLRDVFPFIRWIVATKFAKINITLQQIPAIPPEKAIEMNEYAIQHWDRVIYKSIIELKGTIQKVITNDDYDKFEKALQSYNAMKSWYLGIYGKFWLVGQDTTGIYIVPERNTEIVYKVVALPQKIIDVHKKHYPAKQLTMHKVPTKLPLTIVPWYGRLIYDSTLLPSPTMIEKATEPELAKKIQLAVYKAIKTNTAVDHFAELSVKR